MEDVAREAGSSKPRLYRHFADKDDLYVAIAQRMNDDVYQNIRPDFNFVLLPPRDALAEAIASYTRVITESPEVFRFLSRGTGQQGSLRTGYPIAIGRDLSIRVTEIARDVLGSVDIDTAGLETTVVAGVGAVLAASVLWLESTASPTDVQRSQFVAEVSPLVWGLVDAYLREKGIAIAGDEPMFVSLAKIRAGDA